MTTVSNSEKVNEALFLLVTSSCGFILNTVVMACILSVKALRRTGSAFLLHNCVLDLVKCTYCVPFAASLLRDEAPASCAVLGGSFVLVVTASGFNIVAMICCEAYTFSERLSTLSAERIDASAQEITSFSEITSATPDTVDPPYTGGGTCMYSRRQSVTDGRGGVMDEPVTPGSSSNLCCVMFGILMVYVGSVIIHLGPTIIGGDFNYNDLIGNCIFVYGTVKSYVVQTMWIVIMTLAMTSAIYLLSSFYRHLKEGGNELATNCPTFIIPRGMVATLTQQANSRKLQKAVRYSLSRSRVFFLLTVLFIVCWYPLYILTLFDLQFQQPTKVYKLLTFLACSNASLDPLVLILFDGNITYRLCCKRKTSQMTSSTDANHANKGLLLRKRSRFQRLLIWFGLGKPEWTQLTAMNTVYERVGCRLGQTGPSPSFENLATFR